MSSKEILKEQSRAVLADGLSFYYLVQNVVLNDGDAGGGFVPGPQLPNGQFTLAAIAAKVSCPMPQECVLDISFNNNITLPVLLSPQGTVGGYTHFAAWQLFAAFDPAASAFVTALQPQFVRSATAGVARANLTFWGYLGPLPK